LFRLGLARKHFRLLPRCNSAELSTFMRRLPTGYAVNFNHRHKRSGHLFQNRYKSIICEEDAYLLELIRYIHLNPLRAGMVGDLDGLDNYPWSGHAVLMGKHDLAGQVVDGVVAFFRETSFRESAEISAIHRRRDTPWTEARVGGRRSAPEQESQRHQDDCANFDDRVLGSGEFIDRLRRETEARSILAPKVSLLDVRESIGELFEVAPEVVSRRTENGPVANSQGGILLRGGPSAWHEGGPSRGVSFHGTVRGESSGTSRRTNTARCPPCQRKIGDGVFGENQPAAPRRLSQ